MEIAFTEWIPITDASSVGEVRRARCCWRRSGCGLTKRERGELALLATEASNNVLIHGGGGQVVVVGTNDEADRWRASWRWTKAPGSQT